MRIRVLEALCGTKLRIHENFASWVVLHFLSFVDYKKKSFENIILKCDQSNNQLMTRFGPIFSNVPLVGAMYI